jgi:hypothetical protein
MATNKFSWTGIHYPLYPPANPFYNADEHAKNIDLIISMMKNGNGDIQPLKKPEVTINGKCSKFYIILIHTNNNIKYDV